MLSHDNYTWLTADWRVEDHEITNPRQISYLPLSHVASQFGDLIMPLAKQTHIHFADANALKGSLLQFLLEVRPHIFFAVPRIYEKIEERLRKALDEKPTI